MSDSEKTSTKSATLRKALVGFGLAAGAAWTLASGFVAPAPTLYSKSQAVKMTLPYRGVCQQVSVLRQGEVLPLDSWEARSGQARVALSLAAGEHQLTLRFHTLLPGLERDYPVTVVVDQTAPGVVVAPDCPLASGAELVTTKETVELLGSLDEKARLFLDEEPLSVDEGGGFKTSLTLQPGWNRLLLRAEDQAGNQTLRRFAIFRDNEAPELVWRTPPDHIFEAKTGRLELNLEDDGEVAGVCGKVNDGQAITFHRKGPGKWVGVTEELIDGEHTVEVRVADASGRVSTSSRRFVINSSEALGDAVLGLGARGEDVALLHDRLREAGYLKDKKLSGVFTKETEKALKALQEAEGFEVTGRAEGATLIALGPRIFVNLAKFSLVLDRPGKPQKRWMIASGSWNHPTTPGDYVIKEKVAYPTWLPPKSDWAKDAKPIPPGPGNPLGTRWIGLNGGALGIHGTNAPWSIGSASSHGCMRMVTAQVEELYELVEVGMPVIVMSGWSEDPRLEKYWPSKPAKVAKTEEAEKSEAVESSEPAETPATEEPQEQASTPQSVN